MTNATQTQVQPITRQAISPVVDAALARFPRLGERAVKAAEIVFNSQIRAMDPEPVTGYDRWQVQSQAGAGAYEVSVRGGSCDCADAQHRAPVDPINHGPMCKHRLAAMYMMRLGLTGNATADVLITRLIAQATAQPAQAEPGLTLYVEAAYSYAQGSLQRDTLTGYRLAGGERVTLAQGLDVSLDNGAFWSAVQDAGWLRVSTSRGSGATGGERVWRLAPQPQPEPEPLHPMASGQGVVIDEDDVMLWA